MRLIRAELSHAPALAELNRQLIRDEGHRNRMTLEQLEQRMKSWLAGEYEAHLIHDNDRLAGYALARREDEHVYIRQFFIVPAMRRRGLGRAAMEQLADHEWSGSRLQLDVLVSIQAGIAFWRAVGFGDYCLTMDREGQPGVRDHSEGR